MYGEILRGILPDYVIGRQQEVSAHGLPAMRMAATATRNDAKLAAELLLIQKEKRTWAILAVYLQEDQAQNAPLAEQVLISFQFTQ